MDRINVLVSGVGAPGGPSIIKCLKKNGERDVKIVGTDVNPFNAGAYLADKFHTLVHANDENFIPNALEICEKENIDVFVPLNTVSLLKLAKYKKDFEKIGTKVLVSDEKAIEIANNKELLLEHLKKNNLPYPEFKVVNSIEELTDAAKEFGYPEKRVCIKPPISHGSRGLRILAEDIDKADLLLNEKPNHIFSTLNEITEIFKERELPRYVVMEYLPGKEYSCDMLLKFKEPLITIPRIREQIKEGVTFSGEIENNEEIKKLAQKIAVSLGLEFNINMQFRYSSQNSPQLIEINPRMAGTIVMNLGAGVNLPYLGVKLALGEEINIGKINYNVKMTRFWNEIFVNNDKAFII